ncbi:MAG TPA: hypothetical protein VN364_08085, partial [Bellilinea sp.]|nr:hypothetical protein [Bellilinea sp.]
MTTNYPNSLDAFTLKTDGIDDVMAADINNVQDAIAAIQVLLGGPPLGWYKLSQILTYFSATSFKIPGDVTARFPVGSKFSCDQSGLKYFYVIAATYAAPDTTVTIDGRSVYTLANAAIGNPKVSYMKTPSGFPWPDGWTILTAPLTSTSFDGDAFSTTGATKIDLSAVFGLPPGVKAVYLYVLAKDSASATVECSVGFAPDTTNVQSKRIATENGIYDSLTPTVPCDANGDIYYVITASGAGTLNLVIRIFG